MSQSTTKTERASGPGDGELLAQFVASRDERSFRALVDRFGPLVWSVSMRVTRQRQDAEDALQATFMTLARRAAAIVHHHRQHRLVAPTEHPAVTTLLHQARRAATPRRPPSWLPSPT